MTTCNKCKGTSIKSRSNYTHGKKSKSTTTMTCKTCGTMVFDQRPADRGGKRRVKNRTEVRK